MLTRDRLKMRWVLKRMLPGRLAEVAGVVVSADGQSVVMTGDIGTQVFASDGGARQVEEVEDVEDGPSPRGQKPATMTDVVAVATVDSEDKDVTT